MDKVKLYILATIVITLCLHNACSNVGGGERVTSQASPEAIAAAVARADTLFKQREDITKLRDSIAALSDVRGPDQRIFEVEWKFAKYNYFLGKLSKDNKEVETAFTKGRDAGKRASELDPTKADGHFWYGANLGELAKSNLLTVGLPSLGTIKETMNKVIEMDPKYQNSSAYDVLAQVELETRLYGGKAEKAVELLETALKNEKENMNIHLHLAQAYLAVKKAGEARKQLDTLLSMKPDPNYLPEYKECVEEAKKMLQSKF